MKIYTRGGDAGETGLLGGDRIPKTSARISAIGEVDELNSVIGLARLQPGTLDADLHRIQNWLFDLGAELACPPGGKFEVQSLGSPHILHLESSIDAMTDELPPLKNFILPGGSPLSAHLHHARSVCRRAERSVLALQTESEIRPIVLQFLNRLSDWLFVAGRTANAIQGVPDIAWQKAEVP